MDQLNKCKKHFILAIIALLITVIAIPITTQAINLGDILKIAGVGVFVDSLAVPLNSFINTLLAKYSAGTSYATKVVPIVSIGGSSYIGAAQVTGSDDLIERTKAVLQIEGQFDNGGFRIKGLIPIDSKNPLHFSKVNGIGISAIINTKL